ncbi:MAG: ATP-grasp domain-containing protein [Anaerolineae bacterium]
MTESRPQTVLCLASYFKGAEFMRTCKRLGAQVVLVTREKLGDAEWPREVIEEVFYMPELAKQPDITHAVSYLARTRHFDVIVPLDDYDVELAASLREHLRIPGMGDTTARYFRDKLAMRMQARDRDIRVPAFVHVLNYDQVRDFMQTVPPPWVFKPRSEAGSIGIRKISSQDEFWPSLDILGDRQSYYVLEKFIPGDVFHVDSIVSEREVVFSIAHRYGQAPMKVLHEGGIFSTQTMRPDSPDYAPIQQHNRQVIAAMNMVRGVTHAEFIKADSDGQFYFLEMAARVGGAYIDRVIEAASGVNMWAEWAAIELAYVRGETYRPPTAHEGFAGLLICLARDEWPDTSAYDDPEITWRLHKKNHVGLLVTSTDSDRVQALLESYAERMVRDFLATLPAPDSPQD